MQDELVSLDGKAVKQAQLLREVKANEATYMLYLNKRDQEANFSMPWIDCRSQTWPSPFRRMFC